ncbi:hypothetical protein HELRODRAFT_156526 [Helobdella robusta]|uniref:Probable ribosome biogenesis protein RLP24 n=1 Tax=Helobdella robusta TaxID=6412 RepID=T1ELY0_HELRO|nr:hypothetical protein HELRODRAFT_156526 [Helobdella robusta]ESO08832.1 hypothetical protein HELRODRAFT_156526 [Helobdella robusta]
MRIERCYFCSSPCYPGHGTTFVRNDNKVFRFCRGKCHKAFNKKRNPRKVRWTKAFRKCSGKELTVDPVYELEKRRNIPIKYERELMKKTIAGMKRIHELRVKREAQYIKERLTKGKELRKKDDIREVTKCIHLIKSPAVAFKINKQDQHLSRQCETTTTTKMQQGGPVMGVRDTSLS